MLVDYSKSLSFVSERGLEIYKQQRAELELDNFNLLYVTLTRAIEQLHIITEKKISTKGEENTNFYSGIFINYLKQQNLWNTSVLDYSFGDDHRVSKKEQESSVVEIHEKFISTPWQEHNIVLLAGASKLWNTEQGQAIDFGNLLHEIFAKIIHKKDVDMIVNHYHQQGVLNDKQTAFIKQRINQVVEHPKLAAYFTDEFIVYNEREIVAIDHQIVIPDRLVFLDKTEVVIIDYKTGSPALEHHQQLLKYENVLKTMNFKVDKKILIYINEEINIVQA